jgi:hypothetical protein
MQALAELPVVSCQLNLSDGIDDIESFRAGARRVNWKEEEISLAVANAVYRSNSIDDVGLILFHYCTKIRFI